MNKIEADNYTNTHECGCGSRLIIRPEGHGVYNADCPESKDHRTFVQIPTQFDLYKQGEPVHPIIAGNFERKRGAKPMKTTDLMVLGEAGMTERLDIAKANFGFALSASGQTKAIGEVEIRLLVAYCLTYGFDPIMHEVVLFAGAPYVMIDGLRRKAQETGNYAGVGFEPVIGAEEKEAWGYAPEDIVVKCKVAKVVQGKVCYFERVGGVTRAEINAKSSSGDSFRHPVKHNKPAQMAQTNAERHALKTAFSFHYPGQEEPEGQTIDGDWSEPESTEPQVAIEEAKWVPVEDLAVVEMPHGSIDLGMAQREKEAREAPVVEETGAGDWNMEAMLKARKELADMADNSNPSPEPTDEELAEAEALPKVEAAPPPVETKEPSVDNDTFLEMCAAFTLNDEKAVCKDLGIPSIADWTKQGKSRSKALAIMLDKAHLRGLWSSSTDWQDVLRRFREGEAGI